MSKKIFAKVLIVVCMLAIATTAFAQRGGRMIASNLRDGRDVRAAFRDIVSPASKSTVRVVCGGRDCALGTIVSSDGWIVTKYSELRDKIVCKTSDGKQYPATVVGYESKFDLALLKIDATGLKPADWADDSNGPAVGELVATSSASGDVPQAIGVISVPKREIPHRPGILGVVLGDTDPGGAKIVEVSNESGADQAGLKPGDIVVRIDETPIRNRENMISTIRNYKPLDIVDLRVKRADQEMNFSVTLKGSSEIGPVNRSDRMNAMGGALSKRSADFPSVIQHDTVLKPSDCGGPLVDLSGKVVGVNIARAGRTESYAVPADRVRALLPDLQSGKFAPKYPLPGAVVKKTEEVKTEKSTDEKKADDSKSRDTSAE
jgi:serine protease Do